MTENAMDRILRTLILGLMMGLMAIVTLLYPAAGSLLFFLSLPVFIVVVGRASHRFFLWLLVYIFIMTSIWATLLLQYLTINGGGRSNFQNSGDLLASSALSGIVIGLLITAALFVILVGAIAAGWYHDKGLTFFETFMYVARRLLSLSSFSVTVKEGEIEGKEKELDVLEKVGGPGKVRIYPGNLVALDKFGVITRVVEAGETLLKSDEKIHGVVSVGGNFSSNEIEYVLTKDKIALNVQVGHKATVETAQATRTRLVELKQQKGVHDRDVVKIQQIVDDGKIIGEEPDSSYYIPIVKTAASLASDASKATAGGIENTLRDVFMTYNFEELFKVDVVTDAQFLDSKPGAKVDVQQLTGDNIDNRKIAQIEKFILNSQKPSALGKGVILNFVDIAGVTFSDLLTEQVEEEAQYSIKDRILVAKARSEEEAARYKAKATIIEARAKAQAKILDGQSDGEARAAFFRELLRELKREEMLQGQELVNAVLQLMGRMVSAKDLENLVNSTTLRRQFNGEIEEHNNNSSTVLSREEKVRIHLNDK